jgi:hypothetical protein
MEPGTLAPKKSQFFRLFDVDSKVLTEESRTFLVVSLFIIVKTIMTTKIAILVLVSPISSKRIPKNVEFVNEGVFIQHFELILTNT